MATIGIVAHTSLIDEKPEVREKRLLIDKTGEILEMHRNDSTYVITQAVDDSISKLRKHNFILLTGKPHCGKTKLALEVASRFAKNGTLTILLETIADLGRIINCKEEHIVILENIFGISRPNFIHDTHSQTLENILFCIQQNAKIIVTTRPLPEKSLKSMTYTYLNKDPSEIVIDLDTRNKLSTHEKIILLKNYMKHFNITSFPESEHITVGAHKHFPERICAPTDEFHAQQKNKLDDVFYDAVSKIDSEIGFPFLCRQFCSHKAFQSLGTIFFKNSTDALRRDDINTIRKKGKTDDVFALQYCVLVYVMLKTHLNLNEVDRTLFQLIINVTYSNKKINYGVHDVKDAIEDSTDYYIKDIGQSKFIFLNKAIQEIVAFSFASLSKDAQGLFISKCDWDILMTFARPNSYSADINKYIIHVDPEFYFDLLWRFRNEVFKVRVDTIIRSEFPTVSKSVRDHLLTSIIDGTPITFDMFGYLQINRADNRSCDSNSWASNIFKKEMSDTTFLSIDEHGNSFVHYWIVEDFQNKTILFEKIREDTPELLEVLNYNRHTPIHFAIYTGRYSFITNHFYRWFTNISRTFSRIIITSSINPGKQYIQLLRIASLSNFYTILRIYDTYIYKTEAMKLVRQNVEDCEEVYVRGKSFQKDEILSSSATWNDVFIKLNTKRLLFDKTRHKDAEYMEIRLFCLRRVQNLTFEFYKIFEEENIDLKEGMDNTKLWIKNVTQLYTTVFTTISGTRFKCDMVELLTKSMEMLHFRHAYVYLYLQEVQKELGKRFDQVELETLYSKIIRI